MSDEDLDDLAAWLRLSVTPGIGAAGKRHLLAAFGLPARIFAATPAALAATVTPSQAQALGVCPPGLEALLEATWRWLAEDPGQRAVLTLADPRYPAALLQTDDPPLMLYAMGAALATLSGRPCDDSGHVGTGITWPAAIAIVGSRNPTPQGELNARQFARSFAGSGLSVVSGLALGIDAAAHEGALEGALEYAGRPEALSPHAHPGSARAAWATMAVVGTGLDQVYPSRHRELARRIARCGLILSEYPVGTPPLAHHFPRRNRIISALGRGTLVVEAAMQSGSLITARYALEQGREVFAIPGSIHSTHARGCHALIKQGAKLVETAQDVIEELGVWEPHPRTPAPAGQRQAAADPGRAPQPAADTSPIEGGALDTERQALLHALGFEPLSLDVLVARTGQKPARLQALLLELELAGLASRMPGGLFQRRVVV